ncbi:hypothetical protein GCM10022279_04940 [Comamonas faecalis]|uniref:Uncharacterized protein n=2 Tax=Comamonas faecalis TaxID=1387849 RepID=A0ABP7QMS3_9BURK
MAGLPASARRLQPDDGAVPPPVRTAALAHWQPGASLWRCPEPEQARDLWAAYGCGQRAGSVQWQLRGARGELLQVFWQE